MTPANKQLILIIEGAVQKAVQSTINGKIDAINKKLDQHIEEVQPYLQGVVGLGIMCKTLVAIGGLVAIYFQIMIYFKG